MKIKFNDGKLVEEFKCIDVARLNNRLTGKSLLAFEHCLIEILADLVLKEETFVSIMLELAKEAHQEVDEVSFVKAYNAHEKERREFYRRYSCTSLLGSYFSSLFFRLSELEERQIKDGKQVTVSHARNLSVLINKQLVRMAREGDKINVRLFEQWKILARNNK